jgi:hypothetical protein
MANLNRIEYNEYMQITLFGFYNVANAYKLVLTTRIQPIKPGTYRSSRYLFALVKTKL